MAKKNSEPKKRPNRTGKPIQVYIPDELKRRIDAHLEQAVPRVSLTAVVEAALVEWLSKREK